MTNSFWWVLQIYDIFQRLNCYLNYIFTVIHHTDDITFALFNTFARILSHYNNFNVDILTRVHLFLFSVQYFM